MRVRRTGVKVTIMIDVTGTEVRGSTYMCIFTAVSRYFLSMIRIYDSKSCYTWILLHRNPGIKAFEGFRTLLRNTEKGKPLSLANAHVMRDAVARKPIVAQIDRPITIAAITVAPATEFVDWTNICMYGYPVGEFYYRLAV